MDFIIGGLAGAGATVVTNPMDVVKTRMQLQGELRARNEGPKQYKSIFHALYVIAKTDGLLALQRGLAPAVLLGFTMNSVRLGGYHTAQSRGWTKNKEGDTVLPKAMLYSSISGILSGFTGNPAFVLKTRIQASAHPSIAVGRQHKYKGMFDGCRVIYATEGLKGFFAGINATCLRLAVGSAAQLPTFTLAKEKLQTHGCCADSPVKLAFCASAASGVAIALAMCPFDVVTVRMTNQATNQTFRHVPMFTLSRAKEYLIARGHFEHSPVTLAFVSSLGSGVLCVLIETPLDVANTRLYNQGNKFYLAGVHACFGRKALCNFCASASSGQRLYTGVLDCLAKIYKTEGLHGMYKGLGPLYLRIAPHTTLSLMIWDTLNNVFVGHKNSQK